MASVSDLLSLNGMDCCNQLLALYFPQLVGISVIKPRKASNKHNSSVSHAIAACCFTSFPVYVMCILK
jgi:hypothetical protein